MCFTDWAEHAISTAGAPHLRLPGQDVHFYARHNLDVAAAVLAVAMVATCVSQRLVVGKWQASGMSADRPLRQAAAHRKIQ